MFSRLQRLGLVRVGTRSTTGPLVCTSQLLLRVSLHLADRPVDIAFDRFTVSRKNRAASLMNASSERLVKIHRINVEASGVRCVGARRSPASGPVLLLNGAK